VLFVVEEYILARSWQHGSISSAEAIIFNYPEGLYVNHQDFVGIHLISTSAITLDIGGHLGHEKKVEKR
jgi:hypothetical protein